MSTLKAGAIRGTGASSDAITVHSTDGTFSGNITNRPNKNALINGGMQIAQRVSSNSAINTYGPLDRWRTIGGPMGFTITQVTDATNYPNTHYALKAHRTADNTQEYDLGVVQGIETLNSRPFAGKQVTFSFRMRVGANFSGPSSVMKAIVWTGTGTDDNPANMTNHNSSLTTDITVSTTATKYSVTYTIPSSATQITCGVFYQCRGTAGANDWFEITDCQFELGSVSSDFEYRDVQSELARCQRYYEKSYNLNVAPATATNVGYLNAGGITGANSASHAVRGLQKYIVPKRAVPTIVNYDLDGNSGKCNFPDTSSNVTMSVVHSGFNQASVETAAVSTTDLRLYWHFTADAEL